MKGLKQHRYACQNLFRVLFSFNCWTIYSLQLPNFRVHINFIFTLYYIFICLNPNFSVHLSYFCVYSLGVLISFSSFQRGCSTSIANTKSVSSHTCSCLWSSQSLYHQPAFSDSLFYSCIMFLSTGFMALAHCCLFSKSEIIKYCSPLLFFFAFLPFFSLLQLLSWLTCMLFDIIKSLDK